MMHTTARSLGTVALAILCCVGLPAPAQAQPYSWNGPLTGSASWTGGNWVPGVPVSSSSALITFGGTLTSGGLTVNNEPAGFALNGLTLGVNGAGTTLTLN